MDRMHVNAALGNVEPFENHPDDDALLAELCDVGRFETKTAARTAQRGRMAPAADGPTDREAIVAIGKEVLRQGEQQKAAHARMDRLIASKGLTPARSVGMTQRTWNQFQEVNDRRLREAKTRGRADPLLDQQIDRMNRELDILQQASRRMEAKRNRPPAMGHHLNQRTGAGATPAVKAVNMAKFRKGVVHWMRTGDETFDGERLRDLQTKAMHSELNPSGGYLVMPEQDKNPLNTYLTELSPMRQRASVRAISTNELTRTTRLSGAAARWTAERQGPTDTATPTLGEDTVTPMKMEAYPAASQDLLDDAAIDVEAWLAEEVAEAFALLESDAVFNGNGLTQPRGLLTYPFVLDASWAHGKFRYVATGVSGDFAAADADTGVSQGDKLLDVAYTLKQGHRNNASWLTNRGVVAKMRKMKDANLQYLWQPSVQAGQPPQFLGFPVDEDEFMPDAGADTYSLGFGDWNRTYEIVDRIGVRVLRDPYTGKPNIIFFTTKRVGGSVKFFDAAIFLKFGS